MPQNEGYEIKWKFSLTVSLISLYNDILSPPSVVVSTMQCFHVHITHLNTEDTHTNNHIEKCKTFANSPICHGWYATEDRPQHCASVIKIAWLADQSLIDRYLPNWHIPSHKTPAPTPKSVDNSFIRYRHSSLLKLGHSNTRVFWLHWGTNIPK